MSDEEKYRKLREKLRNTPRLKARNDFDNKLYARLRTVESERMSPSFAKLTKPGRERNWIFSFLRPSFAPAIGLTVVVLIALVWYFAAYNPVTQDKQVSSNENTQQKISPSQQNESIGKMDDKTIAKNETSPSLNRESEPKSMTKESVTGSVNTSSDFESSPKTETEEKKADEFRTFDVAPVVPVAPIESEKKMEKRIEDSKKMEKKEAPANIRKEDSDKINEQKQEGKSNDEIYNKINQSVQDTPKQKDSTKDSVKSKGLKKNIGKSQNDSLNIQSIKKSQEPDSTNTKK
jgi:hypothetical protein